MERLEQALTLLFKEELNPSQLRKLVWNFRKRLEQASKWSADKICFKNKCFETTDLLIDYLKTHGYDASKAWGEYCGASADFFPDTSNWDEDQLEDYEWELENLEEDDVMCHPHFWVLVGEQIVDITADQFHPGKEDKYRVIIVSRDDERYNER